MERRLWREERKVERGETEGSRKDGGRMRLKEGDRVGSEREKKEKRERERRGIKKKWEREREMCKGKEQRKD